VESLLISERGRTLRVPLAEVLYLRAELKYVTVRTASASHLLDGSLSRAGGTLGRALRAHPPQRAGGARRHARAGAPRGRGRGRRLGRAAGGVDEALAVSRRQLAAVRAALGQ
jgi:two-component system response regulator AlgR